MAVDTSTDKNATFAGQKFDASNHMGNTLTALIDPRRDWPTGRYRVDLLINRKKINSIDYTVAK